MLYSLKFRYISRATSLQAFEVSPSSNWHYLTLMLGNIKLPPSFQVYVYSLPQLFWLHTSSDFYFILDTDLNTSIKNNYKIGQEEMSILINTQDVSCCQCIHLCFGMVVLEKTPENPMASQESKEMDYEPNRPKFFNWSTNCPNFGHIVQRPSSSGKRWEERDEEDDH